MSKLKYIFVGLVLLMTFYGFVVSQNSGWKEIPVKEYDEIMKKASEYFNDEVSFSVNVSISSYRTHDDKTAFETQKGFFIRSGKNFHHYLMGIHTIQNKKYRFVIDSAENNIMVANPISDDENKILLGSFEQFHSHITKTEILKLNEVDRIRITFLKKNKVERMELEIDKNGFLRKSVAYFRIALSENENDAITSSTKPRLETVFTNYKKVKADDANYDESKYFVSKNNKFIGVNKYSTYKIKDTRIK